MIPPAEVVEYDDSWPLWFAELDPLLAGVPHEIEHVGSTAVPGLAAKPIIDVDVVVPSADQVVPAVTTLAAGGTGTRAISGAPDARRSSPGGRTRPGGGPQITWFGWSRRVGSSCCLRVLRRSRSAGS